MTVRWWAIERQLPGGLEADWVEICRCNDVEHVAAVVRSILLSAKTPDVLRIRQMPDGL